jgi:hypothetical protein
MPWIYLNEVLYTYMNIKEKKSVKGMESEEQREVKKEAENKVGKKIRRYL